MISNKNKAKIIFIFTIISILVFSNIAFADLNISKVKSSADKFFDNGSYKRASELYIKILESNEIESELEAYILYKTGRSYEFMEDYENSSKYYYKSLKINNKLLDYEAVNVLYFRLGLVFEKLENTENAVIAYENSYSVSKAIGNKTIKAHSSFKLGLLYYINGNAGASLRYFMDSLKYHADEDNLKNAGVIAYYIGNIYIKENENDKALKILEYSMKALKKIDSKEWTIVKELIDKIE